MRLNYNDGIMRKIPGMQNQGVHVFLPLHSPVLDGSAKIVLLRPFSVSDIHDN